MEEKLFTLLKKIAKQVNCRQTESVEMKTDWLLETMNTGNKFVPSYSSSVFDSLGSAIGQDQGWGQIRICICVFVFESSVFVFDFFRRPVFVFDPVYGVFDQI